MNFDLSTELDYDISKSQASSLVLKNSIQKLFNIAMRTANS